jgi:hypothetical protein
VSTAALLESLENDDESSISTRSIHAVDVYSDLSLS